MLFIRAIPKFLKDMKKRFLIPKILYRAFCRTRNARCFWKFWLSLCKVLGGIAKHAWRYRSPILRWQMVPAEDGPVLVLYRLVLTTVLWKRAFRVSEILQAHSSGECKSTKEQRREHE